MTIDYSSPADNTITYPILGIRKRSGFRDTPVHVRNFGGFSNTNDQMLFAHLCSRFIN